ncbi:MAG TPA: cbb3-type cytochrome c oxidase subunit II [Chitinophagaceae bacterium]|nr:cbb3-type cytochrome c oxidase subunit II [Chitinophagaceae bacterium]
MFNFHKNHKSLALTSFLVFLTLSILIAVVPAYQIKDTKPLPSMPEMSEEEMMGLSIYVSENCAACHTQQVRNIEMDNVWGSRPSIPSDYYYSKKRMDIWRQSPSLLGSERTGPDLTDVGNRQAGKEWHLLHLYNPRTVVKESVMPSYPWLFEEKNEEDITDNDVVVAVPKEFLKNPNKKIVATPKAMNLVAYLISLKQADLQGTPSGDFIPATKKKKKNADGSESPEYDGEALYASTCASCHQPNGEGLAGAFPPLAGSPIVNADDPELFISIILKGYDARPEYGMMIGFEDQLSDEEIAAIATHERSSWGNNASEITLEQVKEIREYLNNQTQ